jgi:hypothetical protein
MPDKTNRKYESDTLGLPGLKMVLVDKKNRDIEDPAEFRLREEIKPELDKQSTISRLIAHLKES